jgi:hypothetical protein
MLDPSSMSERSVTSKEDFSFMIWKEEAVTRMGLLAAEYPVPSWEMPRLVEQTNIPLPQLLI